MRKILFTVIAVLTLCLGSAGLAYAGDYTTTTDGTSGLLCPVGEIVTTVTVALDDLVNGSGSTTTDRCVSRSTTTVNGRVYLVDSTGLHVKVKADLAARGLLD
jgi:hypothetical protein